MRPKYYRVLFDGQRNAFITKARTWSAAVMNIIHERFPDGELDEWSRRLEPQANHFQGIIRSPFAPASFAISGECREATSAEVREMYLDSERKAAA